MSANVFKKMQKTLTLIEVPLLNAASHLDEERSTALLNSSSFGPAWRDDLHDVSRQTQTEEAESDEGNGPRFFGSAIKAQHLLRQAE